MTPLHGPPPTDASLTLRVLRPLACLVPAVLLAFDFARIAREHPRLSQSGAQGFGSSHERPRDAVPYGVRLRGDAAADHANQHVILALGLGELEWLHDAHPGRVARKVIFECAL